MTVGVTNKVIMFVLNPAAEAILLKFSKETMKLMSLVPA